MGLLLGFVRIATGSLLAAMLLHAGFSAIGVGASFLVDTMPIQGFTVADTHTSLQVMAPSVVAVGFALVMLRRTLLEAPGELPVDFVEEEESAE